MADLDPIPQSLDQAYDLGFCDGSLIGSAGAAELARLQNQCERCGLHRLAADLNWMEASRNLWRNVALVAWVPLAIWVLIQAANWIMDQF